VSRGHEHRQRAIIDALTAHAEQHPPMADFDPDGRLLVAQYEYDHDHGLQSRQWSRRPNREDRNVASTRRSCQAQRLHGTLRGGSTITGTMLPSRQRAWELELQSMTAEQRAEHDRRADEAMAELLASLSGAS